jgi:histone deacetylase 11
MCYSLFVSKYVELPLCILPASLIRWRLLNPCLYATQGTIDGGLMAIEKGWAINFSGGYHHAHCANGGGFCIYPDITLVIRYLKEFRRQKMKKFMIIDLDAHQGNGHERDFMDDDSVFVFDAFNPHIYPGDTFARKKLLKKRQGKAVHITSSDGSDTDENYLLKIS